MSPMPPPIQPCAAPDARRCVPGGRRVLARGLAALCMLAAYALPAPARAQQAASGQIFIPGPGERATSGSRATPGVGAGANTDATSSMSGMITIPGPNELAVRGEPPRLGANTSAGIGTQKQTQPAASASAAQPALLARSARSARSAQAAQAARVTQSAAPSSPAPPPQAVASAAPAQDAAAFAGQQDGESIRRTAQTFLEQQAVGLPGKVTVTVSPAFARGLAACTTLVPFMPPGARMWGRTTVGVRCAGARPWTLYLQARISLEATYYLAARQIEPGAVITPADLTTREGDLANLPRTIVTDASQAVGAVALARITAGLPLRQDMLRSATSVTIGQTVRVIAVGAGFTISSEGSVMNNAAPGQQVRVKTPGGQIISGVVKDGSTVEIQM
jgi:flagellar basal body P-ring formation protein FlgA